MLINVDLKTCSKYIHANEITITDSNNVLDTSLVSEKGKRLFIEIFKDKILFDYENGKILINGKEDTITYSLNQNIQTIHSQMESRCVRIAEDKGWSIYKGVQIHS